MARPAAADLAIQGWRGFWRRSLVAALSDKMYLASPRTIMNKTYDSGGGYGRTWWWGGRSGLVMFDLFVGIQVMFGHALVMYREWTKNACVIYVGLWYVAFG